MFFFVVSGNILARTLIKGEQKTLPNGITIVNYKAEDSILFTEPISGWEKASRSFDVDWPESAPEEKQDLLGLYRLAVLRLLNDGENLVDFPSNNEIEKVLSDLLEINVIKDEDDFVVREVKIAISRDGNITTVSEDRYETYTSQQEDPQSSDYISISDLGQVLSYSLFPSMEKFKPLLLKYLTNWGEPVKKSEYGLFYDEYPDKLPVISEEYIEFNWGFDGSGSPLWQAKIPLAEFKKLASPILLEFLP